MNKEQLEWKEREAVKNYYAGVIGISGVFDAGVEAMQAEIAKRDEFIIDLYKAFSGILDKAILKENNDD